MEKYKMAFTNIWMGPLPSYFPLWVRSVEANPAFDFILVTDQTPVVQVPGNLKIITMTFDSLRALICRKLGVRVNIQFSYKLCDFKPAYGEILSDYLHGYAFWGCCDLDMLFGDLGKFLTDNLLSGYKKLFSRGHLQIFKNEPAVNAAYRSSKLIDYKEIYASFQYCLFDEWHGIHKIFDELQFEQYNEEVMADIMVYSTRLRCTNLPNYDHQLFAWQDGKVKQYYLQDGRLGVKELAYVHFQKRKMNLRALSDYDNAAIILGSHSFVPYEGAITADTVRSFDKPDYMHYLRSHLKRINKRIRTTIRKDVPLIDNTLAYARQTAHVKQEF